MTIIFFENKNTRATLATKINKNQGIVFKDNWRQFLLSINDNSRFTFCSCPNECNALHWWAEQNENYLLTTT